MKQFKKLVRKNIRFIDKILLANFAFFEVETPFRVAFLDSLIFMTSM